MKNPPCSMIALVEASHDGRLGEPEAASLGRHLRSCAACTRLAADLASLRRLAAAPPEVVPPLAHQRGRLRLLREAAAGKAPRGSRRTTLAAAIGLAAVLLLGLATALWRGAHAPDRTARAASGASGASSSSNNNNEEHGAGATASQAASNAGGAGVRTVTTVEPSEGAQFSRQTSLEIDVVRLTTGTLDVAVRKLAAGERFLVRTSDAEVEVRGTRFRVVAVDGKLTAVVVQEGRVEVRWSAGTRLLEPGAEWRAAVAPAAEEGPATASAVATAASGAPASTASGVAGPSLPRSAAGTATPWPPRSVSDSKTPSPARSADSSAAFRDGVKRMEQGDYGAAAERLRGYAEANPGDARAEDAAFLAVLSLQRAGRPREAAEAARRYLASFPNGYRRAEAKVIAGQ